MHFLLFIIVLLLFGAYMRDGKADNDLWDSYRRRRMEREKKTSGDH